LTDRRFRITGQPVEVEFVRDTQLVLSLHAWPQRLPTTLTRVQPAKYTRVELAKYAGSYFSEELGATYTVSATDSTLTLKTRWGTERTVRPAYGDTFIGDFLLTFTRNAQGQVDRMLMSSGRVRNVAFVKSTR
jgi:hypothetical protein